MTKSALKSWQPPESWKRIRTIDLHTGGEPLRVILDGIGEIPGAGILEKRRYFRDHLDDIRRALMWEPRGHADMYGAVVTEPVNAGSDFGTFFLHNEGYSTMCGHAIIALTTLMLDTGAIAVRQNPQPLVIDAPPGLIRARGWMEGGKTSRVDFLNVPSFVLMQDRWVEVEGIGRVKFDIAYGGAFYALVEAETLGLVLDAAHYDQLVDWGRRIKKSIVGQFAIEHPFEKDLSFLYGTIFTGRALDPGNHSRNVCIFADGEVDRSPTGSGVSARAALHHLRGEFREGEELTIESILGTTMTVKVAETTTYGPHAAVIPEVSGSASFTGRHEFWIDPEDPLKDGFIFR